MLREDTSLLMAEGHPRAREYPLGMLWEEVRIVQMRKERETAIWASSLRAAISSVLSEKSGTQFDEFIEDLTDGWQQP